MNFKLNYGMDKPRKDKERLLAVEMLAMSPGISQKEISEALKVSAPTVRTWINDPMFIDALYKRYMEVAGKELPNVISAMIREAKHGNVQAGRLILEHFGKLDSRIKIQVESPFEKFIKLEAEDAEFEFISNKEVTNGAVSIGEQAASLIPDVDDLPDRDVRNDTPRFRDREEKSMLKYATSREKKKVVEREVQRMMYERRKRAKAVELELLGAGRSTKSKRNEWWNELEKLEIKKFGQIQGDRYEK